MPKKRKRATPTRRVKLLALVRGHSGPLARGRSREVLLRMSDCIIAISRNRQRLLGIYEQERGNIIFDDCDWLRAEDALGRDARYAIIPAVLVVGG